MSGPTLRPAAVIFDMDGVLVDSTAAHLDAWGRFLDDHGVAPPEGGIASLFGRPGAEAVATMLDLPEGSEALRSAVLDLDRRADALLDRHGPGGLLVPGATELVERLAAEGLRLAVGTSALPPGARRGLGHLWDAFETVVTADDVARGKPDPAVYLTAAQRLGVPADRCVVIEDAVVGVRAGRAAGMHVIAVTSTATSEQLHAAGADHVVAHLADVVPLLVPPGTTR